MLKMKLALEKFSAAGEFVCRINLIDDILGVAVSGRSGGIERGKFTADRNGPLGIEQIGRRSRSTRDIAAICCKPRHYFYIVGLESHRVGLCATRNQDRGRLIFLSLLVLRP